MLNKKKIIVLILIVLSLFTIMSSANAADITLNSANNFKQSIESNQTSLSPSESLNVTLFSGTEFILNSTNNNVNISKNVTIKSSSAQNAVINLNGSGRAFNVTGTGNLTLINITIKNGAGVETTFNGAAIYINSGASANLYNCVFTNNTANNYGGAIYNNNGRVNLENCNFTNNSATAYNGKGGAIYNNGANTILTFTGCNFTDNKALYGGAIASDSATSTLTGKNSVFNNNSATNNGGAICYNGYVNLTSCNFTDNSANYGGALYNIGVSVNLSGCNFTNNIASDGSVIYINNSLSTITFDSCIFNNNKGVNGLAIYNKLGNVSVYGSNFTNNIDADNGAAIYNHDRINFNNCNFINNSVSDNGGAIYNSGYLDLTGCNFTNNEAYTGSAVYNQEGDIYLVNCTFENQLASSSGTQISSNKGSVYLYNCNFTNIAVSLNGAIYINSCIATLTRCNFINMSSNNGGTIHFVGDSNLTVNNCTFTNNSATNYGGAIYGEDGNFTANDCNFTGNSAISGGVIWYDGVTVNLTNCNFIKNTVSKWGGAIYNEGGSVNLENCNFTNNLVGIYGGSGGAIYNKDVTAILIVNNSNFTDNSANNGGAICNEEGSVNLTDCNFKNNTGTFGAVIYSWGVNACLVANTCNFTENNAIHGGVIYNEGVAVFEDCDFIGNNATNGGAIYNLFSAINLTVSYCNFTNNSATSDGGAIYNDRKTVNLDNCIFTDNNATRSGGVMNNYEGNASFTDCKFINNLVDIYGDGGVIFNSGNVTLTDCNFKNNTGYGGAVIFNWGDNACLVANTCNFTENNATGYDGGVIYNYNSSVDLTDCCFDNNFAIRNGGAIYNEGGSVNLSGCNFTNNNAIDGAAIYNDRDNVTLENCSFDSNSATNNGGAIYNKRGIANLTSCNFTNNNATNGAAIYNNATATVTANNCNFTDNYCINSGTIYNNGTAVFEYCDFIGNNATYNGAAIYNPTGALNLTVSYCNFTNNSAALSEGGAIYYRGDAANLTACIFTNNSASSAGAIYNWGYGLSINRCNFSYNNATSTSNLMGGGAIVLYNSAIINDCIFTSNSANFGGAILSTNNAIINLMDCIFNNNSAVNGGAISIVIGRINISSCSFTNNSASLNGSAIYDNGTLSILNVSYSVFDNNIGTQTIYTNGGTANLNDNFFYWVNPNSTNINQLKSNITNSLDSITSYYYLNVTSNTIYNQGETLNIRSLLSHSSGIVDASKLPDANISLWYNSKLNSTFSYKTVKTVELEVQQPSNTIELYSDYSKIYELQVNVVGKIDTLLTVQNVSGLNGGKVFLIANLTADGDPIDGAKVLFFVNNVNVGNGTTNSSGIATYEYTLPVSKVEYYAQFIANETHNGFTSSNATVAVIFNYTNLESAIGKGMDILSYDTSDKYTTPTWNKFNTTLLEAIQLNSTRSANTQQEIDDLTNELKTAIEELLPRSKLNYTDLEAIIIIVNDLNPDIYNTTSWGTIKAPLQNAEDMNRSRNASSQKIIDDLVKELNDTKNALVLINKLSSEIKVYDVSSEAGTLVQLIANLTSDGDPIEGLILFFINDSNVANRTTTNGIAILNHTISANAQYYVKFLGTGQYEPSQSLNATITVKPTVSYTTVVSAINSAKNLNQNDYTPASWANLQNILKNLQALLDAQSSTQAEIDAMIILFNNAKNSLVLANRSIGNTVPAKLTTTLVFTTFKPLFNKATNIKVTAYDKNGNILANKAVNLLVNGKVVQTLRTNSFGVANFKYTFKTRSVHKIVAQFTGDTTHSVANTNTLSLTPKDKTTLSLAKVKAKFKQKATFKATLKNSKNKAFANKVVKFYANKKLLGQVKTDAKGVATLTKVVPIKGSVSFIARYAGDKKNHNSDFTRKIKVK